MNFRCTKVVKTNFEIKSFLNQFFKKELKRIRHYSVVTCYTIKWKVIKTIPTKAKIFFKNPSVRAECEDYQVLDDETRNVDFGTGSYCDKVRNVDKEEQID